MIKGSRGRPVNAKLMLGKLFATARNGNNLLVRERLKVGVRFGLIKFGIP